ncbi:TetR/AcrR family transcriptional regulator [Streptomyces sp. NPDC087568]|uniref:TetR/AcrR family transcriptional regulator n=1 Tax=Streptomyces sp. NPDC087568 TaxID=3365799 RepID=UPI0037FA9A4E
MVIQASPPFEQSETGCHGLPQPACQVSEGGEQRADVIVEAPGRLFFGPGLARVSMDDLARELGMSKQTIYRHFPDKRSLVTAVLDRQFAAGGAHAGGGGRGHGRAAVRCAGTAVPDRGRQ